MSYGGLTHATYLEHIEQEGGRFLAAGRRSPLDATIVSYPGFTVEGLASHVGRVLIASGRALRGGTFEFDKPESVPQGHTVFPWLEDALADTLRLLRETDPASPAEHYWKSEPQTAGFFARYLAVEIATHRWDEETPSNEHLPIPLDLAVDGIDYTISAWLPTRGADLAADLRGTVALAPSDAEAKWRIWDEGGALHAQNNGHADATVTLNGPTSDLFLVLWKRIDLPSQTVTVHGDEAVAERLLSLDYVVNPKTTPFH